MEEIILISYFNDFSIIIIETSKNCKITKWGYAKNDDSDILVVG